MKKTAIAEPIGVLCGGFSAEREISLRSGQGVFHGLGDLGYNVQCIDVQSADCAGLIRNSGVRTAFVALHGIFGEDGAVQTLLDALRIPYTGSRAPASQLCMDKQKTKERLIAEKIPVPRGYTLPAGRPAALDGLSFPFVVKPLRQGSSIGMTLVENAAGWVPALNEAGRFDDSVLCEEYLTGPELTVGILDDAPLPVIQVVPQRRFYDTTAKYTPGMTQVLVPAPIEGKLAAQAQTVALKAHQALGCRSFSRVDMILTQHRGPVVLEVNTVPGLTATSLLPKAAAAVGISFSRLCERLLFSAV
ncbi:MAG: D-alanine--D-alanine ligase [Candidatus Omnitrophica bacterium]|nr:D-alanine--D-alanine ligase [Candidatus Omnitrophota bacterium]